MAKKKPISVPMVTKVELWPFTKLVPSKTNANKHPEEQVTKIAASIREFGFMNPIIVRESGEIVAGEGRWRAAERLGLEQVPVILATHLDEEQIKMYVIADNRIARDSYFDDHMLAIQLDDLRNSGKNVNILGFTEDEMRKFIGDGSKAAPVEPIHGMEDLMDAPEPSEKEGEDANDLTVIAHPTSFKQQLEVLNTLRGLGVLCETKAKKVGK